MYENVVNLLPLKLWKQNPALTNEICLFGWKFVVKDKGISKIIHLDNHETTRQMNTNDLFILTL